MIYSRFLIAICIGIFIPSFFNVLIRFFPVLDSIIFIGLCFILTYGLSGYVSVWSAKQYAYLAATLAGTFICVFQYSYTVLFVVGDIIFTPELFIISLLMGITMSNIGAWIHMKKDKSKNQPIEV